MHLTCPQQRGKMYHLGLCSNLGCQGSPSFVKRTGTFTENSLGKHLTGHILCQHNFYYEAREDKREKRKRKGKNHLCPGIFGEHWSNKQGTCVALSNEQGI